MERYVSSDTHAFFTRSNILTALLLYHFAATHTQLLSYKSARTFASLKRAPGEAGEYQAVGPAHCECHPFLASDSMMSAATCYLVEILVNAAAKTTNAMTPLRKRACGKHPRCMHAHAQ